MFGPAIFEDQERLRENLKALSDNREDRVLRQRYISQLEEQEDQLKALRAGSADQSRWITEEQASISRLISELSWGLAQPKWFDFPGSAESKVAVYCIIGAASSLEG